MNRNDSKFLSSSALHILAMGLMLCDHAWATLFPAAEWLTCIGRIAFPIFAFLLVEGYFHTHSVRRYLLRLLAGAVISEIPFNLMVGGGLVYPVHQNVMWTFLIGLALVALIDKCRARFAPVPAFLLSGMLACAGYLIGTLAMVDYFGEGVLMVLVFYAFRGGGWPRRLARFAALAFINIHMLGGYYYAVPVFGHELEIVQQGFALFALIPIELYNGQKGIRTKAFQTFCYAFYPAHMLLLFFAREIALG